SPLRDILSRDPLAAITPRQSAGRALAARPLAALGAACVAVALLTLLVLPQAAILGMVALIGALLLWLPLALDGLLVLVVRLARRRPRGVPPVPASERRSGRSRAGAIAAPGALAVFGSFSTPGPPRALQRGLENPAHDMNPFPALGVSPAGSFDLLMTQP